MRITIGLFVLTLLPWQTATVQAATMQAQPGMLGGVARTPDGKLAPHVLVTIHNEETHLVVDTVTDARGYYAFSDLPPGRYTLRAASDKPALSFHARSVEILAGLRRGFDIPLAVNSEEWVDVHHTLDSRGISTRSGTAARFDRTFIEAAAVANGRTLQSVLPALSGIVFTESTGTLGQYTTFGQSRFANRLTIDSVGADLAVALGGFGIGQGGYGTLPATTTSGTTHSLFTLASVDEIQVRTVNASPQYAHAPGAQTAIVTRSGGNRFNAEAFADLRPNALMASDWFANAGNIPPRRAMSFGTGLTAGGPIVRSRAFFFGSFERQRTDRAVASTVLVPSLEVRGAVAAREDAHGPLRALFEAYPAPNGATLPDGLAELSREFPLASRLNAFSVRLDATLTPAHAVFARVHLGDSSGDELTDASTRMPATSYAFEGSTRTRTATLGWNTVLGGVVNQLRANVTHHAGQAIARPLPGVDHARLLAALIAPDVAADDALVRFSLYPDRGGSIVFGRVAAGAQRQFQIANTLTVLRGRHELRSGVSVTRLSSALTPASTSYVYRTRDLEDFLMTGRILTLSIARRLPAHVRRDTVAFFAQDTWKLDPRLSLDYGIRYDVRPSPVSASDVEPLLMQFEALPELQPRPSGSRLWHTSWRNLNPHVFATWQTSGTSRRQTTLRAGMSVVADDLSSPGASAYGRSYPYVSERSVANRVFPLSASDLTAIVPDSFGSGRGEVFAIPNDLRTPSTYQWQFGIDQQLARLQRASLTYVQTSARQLVYWQSYQPAGSAWIVQAFDNNGSSDYHALVTDYQLTSSRVRARISHTWSHAIDTDSGEGPDPNPPATLISPSLNRGNSDFDRRHVLRIDVSLRLPTLPLPLPARLRTLGANWDLHVIGAAQSGAPVSVKVRRVLDFGIYTIRPDVVPDVPQWIADDYSPSGRRINHHAFAVPPDDHRMGTAGRNTLRASTLRQIDLALARTITIKGRKITMRVDAFNVLNIPNFGPPYDMLGFQGFGEPVSSYADALGSGTLLLGGLTPHEQTGAARSIRLGIRGAF